MTDKIASVLGIQPLAHIRGELVVDTPKESNALEPYIENNEVDQYLIDAAEDFADVRANLKEIIEAGKDVFDTAKIVATSGQDARGIEAFSKVLDSMVRANKELMAVHKDMFGLQPPSAPEVAPQQADTINNIIFTGTTAEMFKKLKEVGMDKLPSE